MKLASMIKGILVLFNMLGLFLCRLFFPVMVNVSQTAPYSAQVNNSFMVQVAINKGDLKGVAKFTEQLPAGFTAVAIDNQGAKTNFADNTIQFSWDSLPADGIMNISFRVDVGASSIVSKDTLTGKFFYTVDNQKLESDCMPSFINITGGSQVTESTGSHQIDSVKECAGGVFAIRRFPSPSIPPNGDAKITIIIHKGNIIGFAKIEDSLPPGFTAAVIDAGSASFTFVDNIAKFVWQSIPSDSIITISYHMLAGSNVSGVHAVSGNFSYIYNNAPLTCSVGSTVFNTTALAGNNMVTTGNVTPPVSPVTNPTTYPVDTSLKNNTANTNTPKATNFLVITPTGSSVTNRADTIKTITINSDTAYKSMAPQASQMASNSTDAGSSIPAPETGVSYRVQLMALHNAVDVSYFSLHKNINLPINTEMNDGFTKYTVGSYNDYKVVRDARESFRSRGITGPFVVSYNAGKRITVQEALMISHQHWLQ
jgi:hypothetical protein